MSDAESLQEVLTYYDNWLQFNQRFLRIPGVQVAVYAEGSVAFSAAYGSADLENDVPLTDRHLFRIASHSKTFTATAVLQLVEQGRLRLDDQAERYVPALAGAPLGERTLRELLSHSAGVTRDGSAADWWQLTEGFPDRERLLAELRSPDAAVIPENERFKYTNLGYGLLGLVIEGVTDTPYNDYVRSEIIDKLGLSDLGPELDPDRSADYATGYSALAYSDRRLPIGQADTQALAPATGFYGNAHDLVTSFAAHLPGDERLLTDRSKREMQHPVWQMGTNEWPKYGLGLQITKVGERRLLGHGGGYPGQISRTLIDPEAGIAVSVLTNAIDGPAAQLVDGFYKLHDLARSRERPERTAELSRFTGRYASLWGVSDIAELGGRLYAIGPTGADPAAAPVRLEADGDTLKVVDGPGLGAYGEYYRFTFDADGKVESMRDPGGLLTHPIERFTLPDRIPAASPSTSDQAPAGKRASVQLAAVGAQPDHLRRTTGSSRWGSRGRG